jgi:hypothetical protein
MYSEPLMNLDISLMDDADRLSEMEGLKCILLLFFDKKIPFPLLISYIGDMSTGRVAFFLCVLSYGLCFADGVQVFSSDEGGDNQLVLRLKLVNSTGRTLHNIRAHYFFVSEDGEEPVVESYYVPRTRVSIERIDSVNFSLDMDVDSLPEGLFPDEGGLSIGLHHADWSAVEKDDDYSYLQSKGFGINENIPVIADSLYSWGNIPDFYTPSELSCKSCPLSSPEPFSLNDGVKIVLKKNEPLRFAWMPVPGARSYRLSVYSPRTRLFCTRRNWLVFLTVWNSMPGNTSGQWRRSPVGRLPLPSRHGMESFGI